MKDAKGHGSNPREGPAHQEGVDTVGRAPKTMYHGSAADFSEFQLGHGSPGSQNGMWFADEPSMASEYAKIGARYGGEAMLYSASVGGNMATQKQWDDLENKMPGTQYTFERDKQIVAKLKESGYDGVRFGNAAFVFDPTKARILKKERVK